MLHCEDIYIYIIFFTKTGKNNYKRSMVTKKFVLMKNLIWNIILTFQNLVAFS